MFGTDMTGSVFTDSNCEFWDGMCEPVWSPRAFLVDPPARLPAELADPRVELMIAIDPVRVREGRRIERLASRSSEELEMALYWLAHATVEDGVGDMSVPRGRYPPEFADVCKYAAKGMGNARNICPGEDKKRTNELSKQYVVCCCCCAHELNPLTPPLSQVPLRRPDVLVVHRAQQEDFQDHLARPRASDGQEGAARGGVARGAGEQARVRRPRAGADRGPPRAQPVVDGRACGGRDVRGSAGVGGAWTSGESFGIRPSAGFPTWEPRP